MKLVIPRAAEREESPASERKSPGGRRTWLLLHKQTRASQTRRSSCTCGGFLAVGACPERAQRVERAARNDRFIPSSKAHAFLSLGMTRGRCSCTFVQDRHGTH